MNYIEALRAVMGGRAVIAVDGEAFFSGEELLRAAIRNVYWVFYEEYQILQHEMPWSEVVVCLAKGHRVRNPSLSPGSFIFLVSERLNYHSGVTRQDALYDLPFSDFTRTDWEIVYTRHRAPKENNENTHS